MSLRKSGMRRKYLKIQWEFVESLCACWFIMGGREARSEEADLGLSHRHTMGNGSASSWWRNDSRVYNERQEHLGLSGGATLPWCHSLR